MKVTLSIAIILSLFLSEAWAQSTFRVRNSTWQDFNVEVIQSGAIQLHDSTFVLDNDTVLGWWDDEPVDVFTADRTDIGLALGETAVFEIRLNGAVDTLTLLMRLEGQQTGTSMEFSISVNGVPRPYTASPDFQEFSTTLFGTSVIIKYRADNADDQLARNVLFTLHDMPIYTIEQADFNDPNVMNAMFYNVQMLPFGVSGLAQASDRAALLPAQISPYQDVVVYCEVFDNGPREDHLIPAMTAAGFIHRTEVLNPNNGIIPIPWNGGVQIFSRWPIETEADLDFEFCGQASQDCLANKGIKYARVNKMGKRYHIFGTHMDAGGEEDDIHAKRSQMGEMRMFIDQQNIPDGEPVIFGGDFNVAPTHEENLYEAMLDSIGPYVPNHIGYHNSTYSGPFGKIIDNAWGDKSHLVATEATNDIITMRSLEPVLWQLGEFSDHRCALGRFVYPDITMSFSGDTVLCPGADLTMRIESSIDLTYRWTLDGEELPGMDGPELILTDAQPAQSGRYVCEVGYTVIYGNDGNPVTAMFYPNGPDTIHSVFAYDFGQVTIDQVQCQLSADDLAAVAFQLSPNPTGGECVVRLDAHSPSAFVEVYDLLGRPVQRVPLAQGIARIDLSAQNAGVYLIRLMDGDRQGHQRIVLTR